MADIIAKVKFPFKKRWYEVLLSDNGWAVVARSSEAVMTIKTGSESPVIDYKHSKMTSRALARAALRALRTHFGGSQGIITGPQNEPASY